MADTEPKRRLGPKQLILLSSFWFGLGYLMQPLGGLILPKMVEHLTRPTTLHLGFVSLPVDINTYVSFLESFGALFAVVWQPAIGALSDRSRFAVGRRRPYIALGVLGDVLFLSILAFATSYWFLLVVYILFQIASNTAQGPYQGMLPDQVPDDQRGEASGYYGGFNLLGTIVGFLVVGSILMPQGQLRAATLSLAVVIGVTGAIVVFCVPDVRTTSQAEQRLARTMVLSFAIDARRYRDFAWLMVSRLFFLMAPVGVTTYALNFLHFTFNLKDGKDALYASALQAAVVIFATVMAFTAGFLSERWGRKRLIAAACLIGALGTGLLVTAPTIPLVLLYGVIVGIALGIFLSVDWAFMTDLIPKAEAGRYMGVSNIATASAGVIARPILGPIIDVFNNDRTSVVGYRVMFGIVTGFFLLAWLTLQPVREIKVE
jgi:MFS family permease